MCSLKENVVYDLIKENTTTSPQTLHAKTKRSFVPSEVTAPQFAPA